MKKKLFWNIMLLLLFAVLLAGEVFAIGAVIRLNMLPRNYLLLLIGVLSALTLTVGLMLFIRGKM